MINTRHKGWVVKTKGHKYHEDRGWNIDTVEKTGKFHKQKDLFGLFDSIAVSGRIHKYIQWTCNRPHSHKPYLAWATKHASCYSLVEQWVWYDRKGWIVFKYFSTWTKPFKLDMRKKK